MDKINTFYQDVRHMGERGADDHQYVISFNLKDCGIYSSISFCSHFLYKELN